MKKLKVLVVCEESQAVCIAFRNLGHEAYSCDLKNSSGGHPEWHIVGDCMDYVKDGLIGQVWFENGDRKFIDFWDIYIMHPDCTKLAVSGNRWYGIGQKLHHERIESVKWTQTLWDTAIRNAKIGVAMENPVGVLNSMGNFPKPQYIQPWEFGHGETKKTGLWLYNLPKLEPTNIVEGREQRIWKMPPSPNRKELRSKTYPGIAKAMAEQWGIIRKENVKQLELL